MIPFIHVGRFVFGTYGIMMVIGIYVGYFLFAEQLKRRGVLHANALIIAIALALGGVFFSKLYFALQHVSQLVADPLYVLRRSGFTFYGAVLGDLAVLYLLARHYRVPVPKLLDSLAASCALGYGIGRIGCFLSGDGDYGIPTSLPWGMPFPHGIVPTLQAVHPTPLYEFFASALLAALLWHFGTRKPLVSTPGYTFAVYLIGSGIARFLVEFIKRNPPVLWGLVNAQVVALLSIAIGLVWLMRLRHAFQRSPNGHGAR